MTSVLQFIRSPMQDSPVAVYAWLLERGVPLHDCRVYQGPDGGWRGSGRLDEGEEETG